MVTFVYLYVVITSIYFTITLYIYVLLFVSVEVPFSVIIMMFGRFEWRTKNETATFIIMARNGENIRIIMSKGNTFFSLL